MSKLFFSEDYISVDVPCSSARFALSFFRFVEVFNRKWVSLLAMCFFCFKVPSFIDAILHIIAFRANKKMLRVYARRVIAFMQDIKPFDSAMSVFYHHRKSMSTNHFSVSEAYFYTPISIRIFGSDPNPTGGI